VSEVVDTQFAEEERAALLDEVRYHLPAFLSSSAVERVDPVGDVTELLNLRAGDLRRVVAIHVGLSAQVTAFAAGLRVGLRRPITSSTRPRVVTQAVRGSIDWGATIRLRSTSAAAGLYVVRPARRVFDTPENRALAWVLQRLEAELIEVAPDARAAPTGWSGRLQGNLRAIQAARRHPWLREIPPQRPDAATLKRLAAARTMFYKLLLPEVLRAMRRWIDHPSPADITELLCTRYFEPSRTWQLFELVIALRLARAFAGVSVGKRRGRLLTGTGRTPFASYRLSNGSEILLWYQAWPHAAGASLQTAARARHRIASGGTRPDIVIERRNDVPALLLLELKATRSPSYLGQGLSQLLGYAKERPSLLSDPACAWLVAPASGAFEAASPHPTEPLWVVDADSVATAAVERLASPGH
jgi:hypothetical protein